MSSDLPSFMTFGRENGSSLMDEPVVYIRHEGQYIRFRRLGIQWWHGPNLYFRTRTHIFEWGYISNWRLVSTHFDIHDHKREQAQCFKVSECDLPASIIAAFYL